MKKSVLIMGIIVTLGLAGCVEKIETPSAAVKAEPVAEKLKEDAKSLGISAEAFIEMFNKKAEELKTSFRIKSLHIKEEGDRRIFIYEFSKRAVLSGSVNPDGSLHDALIIAAGDGTLKSGVDMYALAWIVASVTNSEISKKDISSLVTKLMSEGANEDRKVSSDIVNGIKYYSFTSKELGFWFGADPI